MRLFNRDRDRTQPEGGRSAPSQARASGFGHAAFDPIDAEDARRGYPAVTLSDFAASAGLDHREAAVYGAFVSTQPEWPEYTFNVCSGPFPGGRLGLIGHELLELEASDGSIRSGGAFYNVRVTTHRSLGEMIGLGPRAPENKPFAGNAVWIPTTTVHVRAPETNQLPGFSIRQVDDLNLSLTPTLEPYGLPGFRIGGNPQLDDSMLAAVASACRPALTGRRDTDRTDRYIRLRAWYGVVAITVNGYRASGADLNGLIRNCVSVADQLAALCHPALEIPFDTPGSAAADSSPPVGFPLPHPLYVPAYAAAAAEHRLLHEDPSFLTRLLPRCPVPGAPSGVLFGTIPGTSTTGRIAWFEHGGSTIGSVRAAVMMPAAAGAVTPLGGATHDPTGTRVEVVDGIAYCWRSQRSAGRLDVSQLIGDSLAALAATGAAAPSIA